MGWGCGCSWSWRGASGAVKPAGTPVVRTLTGYETSASQAGPLDGQGLLPDGRGRPVRRAAGRVDRWGDHHSARARTPAPGRDYPALACLLAAFTRTTGSSSKARVRPRRAGHPTPTSTSSTCRSGRRTTSFRCRILVIEVSDTTYLKDSGQLRTYCAAAGVPDYWIVNLPQDRVELSSPHNPAGKRSGWRYADCATTAAAATPRPAATARSLSTRCSRDEPAATAAIRHLLHRWIE